jgi:hypothetical protein
MEISREVRRIYWLLTNPASTAPYRQREKVLAEFARDMLARALKAEHASDCGCYGWADTDWKREADKLLRGGE